MEQGSKIAVVRPGNGPAKTEFPHVYELGLERLSSVFGLEPVEFPTCDMDVEELTANPKERAHDIMAAFRDASIDGVIAAIGGTGEQVRVLKHLDADVIRNNPTRFYGYSDNTNLALYLWNQGIISYYGPMIMSQLAMQGEMHEYSIKYAEQVFFEESIGEIEPADRFTDETLSWDDPANLEKHRTMEDNQGWRWENDGNGTVTGRIVGGCFEVFQYHFPADTYLPSREALEGTVLFLETSEEVPDHFWIDMFMMALGERGLLDAFEAIVVGRPKARSQVVDRDAEERAEYRREQRERIKKRVNQYASGMPVVFGLDVGHTHPTVPFPIGGRIEIDTDARTVTFPGG